MTASTDSIKKKIAALLAKAESTTNAFEAESFMAKVNELLEKHQIEMHEVRAAQGDSDPMGKQRGETNLYVSIGWAKLVAGALARYYGCRTVWWKQGNHLVYEVVGRESARVTFELLLPFVVSQVKQQARRMLAQQGTGTASKWEREVGQALCIRIQNMIPVAEDRRAELASTALIPVVDVEAALADFFPDLEKGKVRTLRYSTAAAEAASKVSLHVQATGTGKTKLLK